MKKPVRSTVLPILACLSFALPALAATADAQTAPTTSASTSSGPALLWSVPGVISAGPLGTYFACTNNGSTNTLVVQVEVFDPSGTALNNPSTTQLSVGPGGSVLFGTTSALAFSIDSNLGSAVQKGSARIFAATASTANKYLMCTAFLADVNNSPPTSMKSLPVVKGLLQQGE